MTCTVSCPNIQYHVEDYDHYWVELYSNIVPLCGSFVQIKHRKTKVEHSGLANIHVFDT